MLWLRTGAGEAQPRWDSGIVTCLVWSDPSTLWIQGKLREGVRLQLGYDMLSEIELQNEISSTPALGVQNQARGVSDAQPALEEL